MNIVQAIETARQFGYRVWTDCGAYMIDKGPGSQPYRHSDISLIELATSLARTTPEAESSRQRRLTDAIALGD